MAYKKLDPEFKRARSEQRRQARLMRQRQRYRERMDNDAQFAEHTRAERKKSYLREQQDPKRSEEQRKRKRDYSRRHYPKNKAKLIAYINEWRRTMKDRDPAKYEAYKEKERIRARKRRAKEREREKSKI